MSKFKKLFIWLTSLAIIFNFGFANNLVSIKKAEASPGTVSVGDVAINELMWMGSSVSEYDEWIELKNTTSSAIDLSNWQLTKKSGGSEVLMLSIDSGVIPANGSNGYFLISEYDAAHSALGVDPNYIVGPGDTNNVDFALANSSLQIKLYDGQWNDGRTPINVADDGSGVPLAGEYASSSKWKSMERNLIPGDGMLASNWHTAIDSINFDPGATEKGTPKSANKADLIPAILNIDVPSGTVGVGTFDMTITSDEALITNPDVTILDSTANPISFSGPNIPLVNTYVYNVNITSLTASGLAIVEVSAQDTSGNISSGSVSFTVDTTIVDITAPNTTVTIDPALPNGWYITTPTITLNATDSESGVDKIFYRWGDSGAYTEVTGSSAVVAGIQEGEHTLYYYSVDTHSNTETTKSYLIKLDTEEPSISVSSLPSKIYTSSFSIPYTASDSTSDVDFVNLYYSYSETGKDDDWGPWTQYQPDGIGKFISSPINFDTSLAENDGYYDLYLTATDNAGNAQTAPTGDEEEQASTYVQAKYIAPPTGFAATTSDKKVNLKWNAVEGATSYEIWRSSSPFILIATISATQTQYTDKDVESGKTYQYKIVAIDKAGNKSEGALISISVAKYLSLVPQAEAASQEEVKEEIIPKAEAQEIIPPMQEEGKILGDNQENGATNWTPIVVIISLIVLFIAAYFGWEWYQRRTNADRW
ncbi:MAG: lamin tail domain-containing protein [Candidatus Berkelbacteria bacterium]|nr:lamin tail domain-containing protein [Candidatus Berkelbacteria bacterium]